MRTKHIFKVLALVLCIGAFALPTTAFAAGGKDTVPPSLEASLTDGKVQIEAADDNSGVEAVYIDENRVNSLTDGKASVILKDYAGKEKSVSVYAVDYAGNHSETVKFDNPYYTESKPEAQTSQNRHRPKVRERRHRQSPPAVRVVRLIPLPETQEMLLLKIAAMLIPATPRKKTHPRSRRGLSHRMAALPFWMKPRKRLTINSFTPLLTEAGNVFYLIIDGKRDSQNVYFLNGVTEADLMALAEKGDGSMSVIPAGDTCTCTEKCEAGKVRTDCPVCKTI